MNRGTETDRAACRLGRLLVCVSIAAVVAGCASTAPPPEPGPITSAAVDRDDDVPRGRAPPLSLQTPFEQRQLERAVMLAQQKWLADAAVAWEVLVVLRPDVADYRERLAEIRRQIDSAVAERLPRAASAAQRGDIDHATRQYLAILALQPHNTPAADALRNLERERNKRLYLGRHSRLTITRRAAAEAEMTEPATAASAAVAPSVDGNVDIRPKR